MEDEDKIVNQATELSKKCKDATMQKKNYTIMKTHCWTGQ